MFKAQSHSDTIADLRIKIGVVTNYANHNYGSALQSFALQSKLQSMGYRCENLQYTYARLEDESLFAELHSHYISVKRSLLIALRKGRRDRFRAFRRDYLMESQRVYHTLDELKSSNNEYDAFLCGSDQIWAPNQFDEWYYLSFVEDDKPKIAYAPSIGLPVIPAQLQDLMGSLISRIDHISVRESQGAEIVKLLTGIDVPVVLDPTLLLTKREWDGLAAKCEPSQNYALCYFLGSNAEHRKQARQYCDDHHLKMIAPYKQGDMSLFDNVLKGVGPREFLGLVSGAHVVLTDSFHGCAFAVNYEKDFYVFLRFKDSDVLCQNSRVIHLLKLFGISNRLMSAGCRLIQDQKSINYSRITESLNQQRDRSISFLKSALATVESPMRAR